MVEAGAGGGRSAGSTGKARWGMPVLVAGSGEEVSLVGGIGEIGAALVSTGGAGGGTSGGATAGGAGDGGDGGAGWTWTTGGGD